MEKNDDNLENKTQDKEEEKIAHIRKKNAYLRKQLWNLKIKEKKDSYKNNLLLLNGYILK
jgi:hypothetical protein